MFSPIITVKYSINFIKGFTKYDLIISTYPTHSLFHFLLSSYLLSPILFFNFKSNYYWEIFKVFENYDLNISTYPAHSLIHFFFGSLPAYHRSYYSTKIHLQGHLAWDSFYSKPKHYEAKTNQHFF